MVGALFSKLYIYLSCILNGIRLFQVQQKNLPGIITSLRQSCRVSSYCTTSYFIITRRNGWQSKTIILLIKNLRQVTLSTWSGALILILTAQFLIEKFLNSPLLFDSSMISGTKFSILHKKVRSLVLGQVCAFQLASRLFKIFVSVLVVVFSLVLYNKEKK